VEQRIRTILEDTRASFIGIELSRRAAAAAGQNLDLVTDAYAQGVADILRLLDAQNQALVADLVGANAIFDYLIDLMGSQRAVGRFDYYRSPQDRQAFLSRLDEFFRKAGQPLRTP
jgi:outer membrane protein TolC